MKSVKIKPNSFISERSKHSVSLKQTNISCKLQGLHNFKYFFGAPLLGDKLSVDGAHTLAVEAWKDQLKALAGKLTQRNITTCEPPRGKTNNVVSEQVRHKPTCTSTEKS